MRIILLVLLVLVRPSCAGYLIAVSNERDGSIALVDSDSRRVVATIPVGKRPRGIHASPDGKFLYVALSGTPIAGPPPLDAEGNPIFQKEDSANSDHTADAIGVVDLQQRKLVRAIASGSDPEQFAVSPDGKRLYISNEDIGSASVVNIADGKVVSTIPVKEEPEGVAFSPDGKQVYITCETRGEICVIDTAKNEKIAEFVVKGRPRNVAFVPDGSRAFIPSESSGAIHAVNAKDFRTERVITLPKGSRPMDVLVETNSNSLFTSNGRAGTVSVIDLATLEVRNTIKVGKRPWGMALAPDHQLLYVANGPSNDISVINVQTKTEEARIKTGESPWGVAIVPGSSGGAF